jgi:hypothetical protein
MANPMSSIKASSWRDYFLKNSQLKYTDSLLKKVHDSASSGTDTTKMFESISKYPGIGLLCLDADGEKMIMLHNLGVIGGSWIQDDTKLVLSGFDSQTTVVKIKTSSIIDTKQKVLKLEDILDSLDKKTPFHNIKNIREVFQYKNVVPVPNALVKTFLKQKLHDAMNVAQAFYEIATKIDVQEDQDTQNDQIENLTSPANGSEGNSSESEASVQLSQENSITPITRTCRAEDIHKTPLEDDNSKWLSEFYHIFQFCYLCAVGKIEPIIYTVPNAWDITEWKSNIEEKYLQLPTILTTSGQSDSIDEDDITLESNMSLKDRHMIHALLKISKNLDQNTLRLAKDSEDKAKGFSKLEPHKKLLILNATENDSQDDSPTEPTDFCRAFFLKTTGYRAKETLQKGLKENREIVFIPSTAFTARLYTVDFLWQSPDQPSGISLFFCSKSSTIESDQGYALLEKIDKLDRALLQVLTRGMSFVPTWFSSSFDCRMMNWMIPLNFSLSKL